MFAEVLSDFMERSGEARLAPVLTRLRAPLRLAVCGRAGVGRDTVARAVAGADRRIVSDGAEAALVVFAESVKQEDAAELAGWHAAGVPAVLVGNKADLAEPQAGVPCVALLADVALDDGLVAALRTLAAGGHPLGGTPARLLDALDRHGVALCLQALRRGADPAELPAMLRTASGIDAVLHRLDTVTAPVRYRRVRAALAEAQAVAVDSPAVADFLVGDEVVLAVMTAAVDVLQGAGLAVDRGDSEAAHLNRAVRWRSYGRRAPVNALHRSCAADVCRGSLRLLGRPR